MDPNVKAAAARERMVAEQIERRGIQSPRVLEAMSNVPREQFVPTKLFNQAHTDRALPIACNQTISQPYIVALMTEALELSGREHVLEIGTGSGYQTAILAELAGDVVSVERHRKLSESAEKKLLDELGYQNVQLIVGDGSLGHWPLAPYDRIIVTAAARQCPPALLKQLREGGILVAPLGPEDEQVLQTIRKVAGRSVVRPLTGCRFVPLWEGEAPAEP